MELFSGKTVVISGGAEGIGFAVAQAVGREGMNVVITDISTETLAHAQASLSDQGITVLALTADVRKEADWQRVVEATIAQFGAIHGLMNNAGVGGGGSSGPIEEHSAEDWRWTIDVNLMGVVFGMKTVVPHIKAAGGGWIVNVASMAGMSGFPFGGAYNATKLAVAGLSEGWAMELAPFGIQVAALCPAFVKTRIHLSDRVGPRTMVTPSVTSYFLKKISTLRPHLPGSPTRSKMVSIRTSSLCVLLSHCGRVTSISSHTPRTARSANSVTQ